MKFILKVNNLYLERMSIDSYDETVKCCFSSNINDAKEFSKNDLKIIKPITENLLSIELESLELESLELEEGEENVN